MNRTKKVSLSEAFKEEDGTYWVTCSVNPLELADTITVTLYQGKYTQLASKKVSAMEYLLTVREKAINNDDQELVELVDSLRDYAGILYKVTKFTGEWTDTLPHAEIYARPEFITAFDNDMDSGFALMKSRISNVAVKTKDFGVEKTGPAADSIVDVKMSLTLHSMNVINLYVKPAEGTQILSTPVDTVVINGETYYQFDSPYLKPTELGTPIAFEIETTSGTVTIYASAISYVQVGIVHHLDENDNPRRMVKNLTLALFYEYYEAALAYQNTH